MISNHTTAADDNAGMEDASAAHASASRHHDSGGQVDLGFQGCSRLNRSACVVHSSAPGTREKAIRCSGKVQFRVLREDGGPAGTDNVRLGDHAAG
jgi:hypothetical protein